MRRFIGRWVAIVAVVAGIGAGASALPASAATPGSTSTPSSTSSVAPSHGVKPANDWWL